MEHNALTLTLRRILRSAEEEDFVFTSDAVKQWPDDALDFFEHIGVIGSGNNATGIFCEGCENRCWVEPEYVERRGKGPQLAHCCANREDTAFVYHPLDTLKTWRVNHRELAREIAQILDLQGVVDEISQDRFWFLGSMLGGKKTRRFYLGRGFNFDDGQQLAGIADEYIDSDSILFVFGEVPDEAIWPNPGGMIINLAGIVAITKDEIILDSVELVRVLKKRKSALRPFPTPPDATWKKLIIRVLPPEKEGLNNTHVELQIGRHVEIRSFVEMGMFDDRTEPKEPSFAWTLLLMLAKNRGEMNWSTEGASEKARSHMNILRNCLRNVFQMKDTPIRDYKKKKGWQTEFTLNFKNASP
ncbi:MAG: hypothetical protein JXX14_18765 [Deltaproteobacteria bacterium]|nr:hypothetical protein [Deltaproteobacteria bacterium]